MEIPVPPAGARKIGIGGTPQEGKVADLVVDVTGMQFAWIFNYPESGVNSGELHVPIGADVQINLSATDVIHSFWVPQFRLKQDAIPGIPYSIAIRCHQNRYISYSLYRIMRWLSRFNAIASNCANARRV
jgi:heme/copper-type cytochrome/quinol oxidase subunit 2